MIQVAFFIFTLTCAKINFVRSACFINTNVQSSSKGIFQVTSDIKPVILCILGDVCKCVFSSICRCSCVIFSTVVFHQGPGDRQ